MNEHQARGQQPSGCLTVFVVGICLGWLLIAGAIGGGISYLVACLAGAPSIPSYLGGATAAFVVVWLACPAGIALQFFFLPKQSGSMARSFGALMGAFLGPIVVAPTIFVFAAIAAIAGAFLFRACPPLTAALLIATVFPLVGLVTGVLAGNPEPARHN